MCSVRKLRLRELKKHAQGHTAVEARHGVGAQSCLTSEPTHFPPFGPVGFGVSSRLWGDSDPQNIRVRSPHKEADPEKISPIPITATGKGDISIRMKLRISHLFFFSCSPLKIKTKPLLMRYTDLSGMSLPSPQHLTSRDNYVSYVSQNLI